MEDRLYEIPANVREVGQFLCHVVQFLYRRRKIHLARMEGTE